MCLVLPRPWLDNMPCKKLTKKKRAKIQKKNKQPLVKKTIRKDGSVAVPFS